MNNMKFFEDYLNHCYAEGSIDEDTAKELLKNPDKLKEWAKEAIDLGDSYAEMVIKGEHI